MSGPAKSLTRTFFGRGSAFCGDNKLNVIEIQTESGGEKQRYAENQAFEPRMQRSHVFGERATI